MPGTGCSSVPDTVKLTKHAVSVGCAGVLMLPPFYYKGVSDEGLFRHFAEVVERVADPRLKIYLYHIPPVAQVPITLPLLERLAKTYPQNIVGMKDSSGDWAYTQSVLSNFPHLDMFVGSEAFLLAGMRNGGVGCISATANVNPAAIHDLYANWQASNADDRQAGLTATRMAIQAFPMIPALKATRARYSKDPSWVTVRPPLVALTAQQQSELGASLEAKGFAMPGLDA
jgi:4-hydroxy-tetrahydrodipicolinate synthase